MKSSKNNVKIGEYRTIPFLQIYMFLVGFGIAFGNVLLKNYRIMKFKKT